LDNVCSKFFKTHNITTKLAQSFIVKKMFQIRKLLSEQSVQYQRVQNFALSTLKESYGTIAVEKIKEKRVAIIRLNRPKALNALNSELITELNHATKALDFDDEIGAIIVTGAGDKSFAAGADIKEMSTKDYIQTYTKNMFADWADISKIQTPIIAAVNGFCLGGGCELSMLCDIIICSENAKFGQPEINLGTIPGCGGTQRLIRSVGKSKAMELILTGDMMSAQEAKDFGLVARIYPADKLLDGAITMAAKIASKSKPISQMAKEATNASYEMTLQEGARFERRLFHATFSTNDRREGMMAFVGKKTPIWKHS
jgi:enoyl-CoA hydratase/carnithine racemase